MFASLLTKTEAISALVRTRQECCRLVEKSLFHLQPTKMLSVIDFLQVRSAARPPARLRAPGMHAGCMCATARMKQHACIVPPAALRRLPAGTHSLPACPRARR